MWPLFDVSYLVLEGLRSQSFVERCKISGETLKVALYLLLLREHISELVLKNVVCLQVCLSYPKYATRRQMSGKDLISLSFIADKIQRCNRT